MKKSIKLLEWNLNYASYESVMPASFIKAYIKGFDVIILTEVKLNNALIKMIEALGYEYKVSDEQNCPFSNQIVILAKPEYKLTKISGKLVNTRGELEPDLMHVIIEVNTTKINVIGVRIKTTQHADRLKQAKLMRDYIASIDGLIVCAGDFNCGQLRGADDAEYPVVKELYRYCNRCKKYSNLYFYNYHLLKELVGKEFVLKETMGENNSWGLSLDEKEEKILYGYGNRVKPDLIFYSSKIKGTSKYSWDHVRHHERQYMSMLKRNSKRLGNRVDHGYPDHARLIAELAV